MTAAPHDFRLYHSNALDVLAEVLAWPGLRELGAYTAARRRHLDYYQFATRALTPFFQGDSRILGWLRDLAFPLSAWLGPLRRRMVQDSRPAVRHRCQ